MLLWATLTMAMLLVILFFGLRPRGLTGDNAVALLSDKGALVFKKHGMAFVGDIYSGSKPTFSGELTIEMAIRAGRTAKRGFGSLLMMHDGSDHSQLLVGQWESSIIIMNGDDYDNSRRLPRLLVRDAFSAEKIRFITITAGGKGTRLYVDGLPADADRNWKLAVPQQGQKLRMVVGNSVTGKQSWIGEIHGLGFYGTAFSSEKVKRHYDGWIRDARFPHDATDAPLVLYTFREQIGHRVPDMSGHNQSLQLPLKPIVLEKIFLSPPWHDFKLTRSFFVDAALNLFGFIPLGAVFLGWLGVSLSWPDKQMARAIVVFCFLLSLTMEILQAWMPTRSSSLLDLALNTLGAWLGIWLFKKVSRIGCN
jgi:hypothetical protein